MYYYIWLSFTIYHHNTHIYAYICIERERYVYIYIYVYISLSLSLFLSLPPHCGQAQTKATVCIILRARSSVKHLCMHKDESTSHDWSFLGQKSRFGDRAIVLIINKAKDSSRWSSAHACIPTVVAHATTYIISRVDISSRWHMSPRLSTLAWHL